MSSFRNIKITCPDCKGEGSYTIWDSVNVDLDPKLKEKVMDGSIFDWTCPNCSKSFKAPYSFLYHDMTHNFMVQFDSQRSHIIPFAEYIRVMENGLEINAIASIAAEYREKHPGQNLLFDRVSEDQKLCFTILEMPETIWTLTENKYIIDYDVYLSACEK